ncbi:hypothetical protein N431DRAFT_442960 [Stipitochalara longipes BDJ]|nr:hypothetical protein N431DRAFT_442960 [Stipitochalara longipes BDJ]
MAYYRLFIIFYHDYGHLQEISNHHQEDCKHSSEILPKNLPLPDISWGYGSRRGRSGLSCKRMIPEIFNDERRTIVYEAGQCNICRQSHRAASARAMTKSVLRERRKFWKKTQEEFKEHRRAAEPAKEDFRNAPRECEKATTPSDSESESED